MPTIETRIVIQRHEYQNLILYYTEHFLCEVGSSIILHEDQNRVMDNHNYQDDDPAVDTLSQVSYGLVQH
jgi:hypothetical protein